MGLFCSLYTRSPLQILLALVLSATALAQQPQQQIHLSRVEFKGLERITRDQALEASGLQVGESITVDSLDGAAQKLMDSGLFGKLSYRITSAKEAATVIFDVEELKANVPVVFDNFVWFSDEELFNAVKSELPTFNGTAPATGKSTDSINKALSRLLRAADIKGEVQYTSSASESGGDPKHIFSVTGVRIPVCGVTFKGTRDVKESMLVEKSSDLFRNDFSREASSSFPNKGLLPIYHHLGHLRATINFDSAKLVETDSCKNGVQIAFLVDEGDVYTWSGSEWSGNTKVPAVELSSALDMKQGEVADGLKIEKGVMKVYELYGSKGYLALRLKQAPAFDDRARKVTYQFAISEGPQYKMGTLSITGPAASDIAKLKSSWKLQPGEIFDASYPEKFMRDVVKKSGIMKPSMKAIGVKITPDREKITADVEISLK